MIWVTAFADSLLYVAFSYVAGSIVLQFVPDSKKPMIHTSKALLLSSVTGIALFSAAPVIELSFLLKNDEEWMTVFQTVILDYRVGQGWGITVLLSLLLWLAIYFKGSRYTQAYLALLLILAVGFYSHVSTLSPWAGFISHSIHFLALTLWAGVLLHVAWFSRNGQNWDRFLKWFTPFAVVCVLVLLASGVILMLFFIEPADYVNSWVLPYGQMLLLKHLSILPLLIAALINGFLNKRRILDVLWLRVEVVLLFMVFVFTAIMSKQAPPHNINNTLRSVGTAPFVEWLKGEQYIPINASLALSLNSVLLLALSMLFLGMMLLNFYRQLTPWLSLLFGTVFLITAYAGLMLVVSF